MGKSDKKSQQKDITKDVTISQIQSSSKNVRKIFLSNPLQKSYTMLGLTLIAVILIIGTVVTPTISTVSVRKREIAVLESDLAFLKERFETISRLNSTYTGTSNAPGLIQRFQTVNKYHPANKDTVILINSLQKIAHKNNVRIKSISISTNRDNNENLFVETGTVSIVIWADSIEKFMTFVREFENTPYYPTFSSIGVEESDQSNYFEARTTFPILFIKEEYNISNET